MSNIFDVDPIFASVVFNNMLDSSLSSMRAGAQGWFNQAYLTDPKPTQEMLAQIEDGCCEGAKCLISRFKALEVEQALIIKH